MEYNPLEEIKRNIRNAKGKGGRDVYAIASLLSIEKEVTETIKLLSVFKASSIYKDRVSKALAFFEAIVKKWDKKMAEEGDKAFGDRSEKQWHTDNKATLKRLQKEAKRLKL